MQFEAPPPRHRWVSMTPLIDIVFLLLIFFMLATNFTQYRSLDLSVPGGKGASGIWSGAVLVRVHDESRVDINGRKVALDAVTDTVRGIVGEQAGKHRFIVQTDRGLPLQEVVAVLDRMREGGALSVSLVR